MKAGMAAVAAIAVVMAAPAPAQTTPGDVIVFRRPIASVGPRTPQDTVAQVLSGDTYGWYPYCDEGVSKAACVVLPENGGQLNYADSDASCAASQNAMHTAYLASLSKRYTGSETFFDPPGKPARKLTCSPEHIGYGFKCVGAPPYGPIFACGMVDKESFLLSGADASDCTRANQAGDFTKALDVFGLQPAGPDVDPATACQSVQTFTGRKESCAWRQDQSGAMTLAVEERCYSINQQSSAVTEVGMPVCRNQFAGDSPAIAAARQKAGYLHPMAAPAISCGQADAGKLTRRLVTDTQLPVTIDGKNSRQLSFTYTCTVSGAPASISKCAGTYAAWEADSRAFAEREGLRLDVTNGLGTRIEIYTET